MTFSLRYPSQKKKKKNPKYLDFLKAQALHVMSHSITVINNIPEEPVAHSFVFRYTGML